MLRFSIIVFYKSLILIGSFPFLLDFYDSNSSFFLFLCEIFCMSQILFVVLRTTNGRLSEMSFFYNNVVRDFANCKCKFSRNTK